MQTKFLFIFLMTASLLVSCSKEDKTYTQEQLNGNWKSIAPDENGCYTVLHIGPGTMSETSQCPGSSTTIDYNNVTFDGKKFSFSVAGIPATYSINELSGTQLKMTVTALGQSKTLEFKRL